MHFFDLEQKDNWLKKGLEIAAQHLQELSGTLSLAMKPEKRVKVVDEIKFWTHIAHPVQDLNWYKNIWSSFPNKNLIAGEITPAYSLLNKETIKQIHRELNEPKIILFLRDSIERGWSQVRMAQGSSVHPIDKSHFRSEGVLSRGRIQHIIENWEGVFGPAAVHVAFYEDIATQPHKLLENVCSFLNIEYNSTFFPQAEIAVHVSQKVTMPNEVYNFLKRSINRIYYIAAKGSVGIQRNGG